MKGPGACVSLRMPGPSSDLWLAQGSDVAPTRQEADTDQGAASKKRAGRLMTGRFVRMTWRDELGIPRASCSLARIRLEPNDAAGQGKVIPLATEKNIISSRWVQDQPTVSPWGGVRRPRPRNRFWTTSPRRHRPARSPQGLRTHECARGYEKHSLLVTSSVSRGKIASRSVPLT